MLIGDRTSGYVFTTTDGGTPVSGFSKLKQKLDAKMLAAAQEDDPKAVIAPWRLHDLRRTFHHWRQRDRLRATHHRGDCQSLAAWSGWCVQPRRIPAAATCRARAVVHGTCTAS